MKNILIHLKFLFVSVDSFKNIFLLSLFFVLSWSLLSEILKYNQIVFYNSYNLRILISNIIFSLLIILYFRSMILSALGFYSFIFLPFISYYFLRKGILFGDLRDIDELMYALGEFSSIIIYSIITLFIVFAIFTNIRFFKIKIFFIQIFLFFSMYYSYTHPQYFEKFFYPTKPTIDAFNISAAFRFIGPIDGFFYNYLDTLLFEKELLKNKELMKYDDFRSFNLPSDSEFKNIHIILMESFIDPTDFQNIIVDKNIIPKQWIEFKNKNLFHGITPVIGGGSAQAEFEILCGAPSLLEYGTEFNRIGDGHTNCLPKYLKYFGYKTIASQPMHGSFFNIEKAYESIGFDRAFLAPSFDMTEMNNGWLSDESFFRQHFEILKEFLNNKEPILNYMFAVGCHSTLGQSESESGLIRFSKSKILEHFLNCNAKSINNLVNYIEKVQDLDPDSLIVILSDHKPPGILSSSYVDAGYYCDSSVNRSCKRKMRGIFINGNFDKYFYEKNIAYYEIPEIIINQISNRYLCKTIKCISESDKVNLNGTIVNRESLVPIEDQSFAKYHREIYLSLLKESLLNKK